jgi:recombination protein RecA
MAKKAEKDAKESRLKEICIAINKGTFGGEGHDAVTYLGSREMQILERFSSGCSALDEALGGGWPKGRFIEIFGPESGGKTTLVLHAIAEYQKAYPENIVALVDSEYSFDEEYAAKLGVDTKHLIVHQPSSGQQAMNIIKQLIQAGVQCIIVDSVAALTTKEELEGDIGDVQVADQARMMSRGLRTLTTEAGSRKATVFWTNQVREKIGVAYGDKTTTPAGRALKHYASIRVQVSRIGMVKEKIDDEDVVVSARTKADVKKNKTAPPFKKAEFYISFGHGIDQIAGILDEALAMKVVVKRGAWFAFGDEQLAQGRNDTLQCMRDNHDLAKRIIEAVNAIVPVEQEESPRQAGETNKDVDSIDAEGEEIEPEEGEAEVKDA